MAYPTVPVVTTNLSASTSSPALARTDLLDLTNKFNLLMPLPADLAASNGAALIGGGDQMVSSISALRALLTTSASKQAFVAGYYASGDGGGGSYYYDSTDTTTADNGCTVIVATDGGRWKLALSGMISINQFGAIGNGVANNDSFFNLAEASGFSSIYLPNGSYLVSSTLLLTKEYVGTGSIVRNGGVVNLNTWQDTKQPLQIMSSVIGDTSTLTLAMYKKAAKVVFFGDSITEGVSQIAYEDSYAGLVEDTIRTQAPGVTWTFSNMSLSGRGIGNAIDYNYKGTVSPDIPANGFYHVSGAAMAPANMTLWPSGSVVGKSWIYHVRDEAPDLLIIAFGANDTSGDSKSWVTLMKNIFTETALWAKKPSIVIVSPTVPTRKIAQWLGYQSAIQVLADACRGVAQEMNVSLVDANRFQLAYRDGYDVAKLRQRARYNFDTFPTGWTNSGTLPSLASNILTFSGAGATEYKQVNEADAHMSAVFTPVTGTTTFGFWYRANSGNLNQSYTVQIVTGNTVVFYYNLVNIASSPITLITNGQAVTVEVRCTGARHQVWVNGVKYIDLYDYSSLVAGYYGVQFAGPGTIGSFVAKSGYARVVGFQQLSEDYLFGAVNDYSANINSLGGDTIHHPTIIGHYTMYLGAFDGLLQNIRRQAQTYPTPILAASAAATAGALAATDYIDVIVAGSSNGSVMIFGAAGALGAAGSALFVVTGISAVCAIKQNGVTTLVTTTITFPYSGTWIVMAVGSASHQGANIRHTINAVALKQ